MSLLRGCTPILLLSKSNTNLSFRASTAIARDCIKLRLSDNPKLLWYKVIKTCRCIQQRYSSWNLFVYIFILSVCKIATNMQQKYNASRFCLPNIYKIKNSIVFTQQLCFNFQWYHTWTTCLQKTQFTLLKKIKSSVVFKMNEGQLVVISSDEEDEVITTKKSKLQESAVANRDVFFSIKSVPRNGHCIVNCFSTFLGKLHQKF